MHNTITEYKQMHNKTISWQLNTYLCLFHGYTPSWVFSFIFFIHDSIVSYPSAEVDKRFFKIWFLHIPHCLRDLLWMVRAWSSVAPIFSSRASSSCELSLKVITSFWHTFLTWMNPTILGDHSRWPSPLLLQVVLDLRDSYDCMVSAFWVFTFFKWFL